MSVVITDAVVVQSVYCTLNSHFDSGEGIPYGH